MFYRAADEPLQYRAAEDGKAVIEGYAIVFGKRSVPFVNDGKRALYEVIDAEAVTQAFIDTQDILFNYEHDSTRLLGRCTQGKGTFSVTVDDKGVRFCLTPPDTEDGRMVAEHVRLGNLRGCSFAFVLDKNDREAVYAERTEEDGRRVDIVHIRRMAAVRDFTITAMPVYPDTEVCGRLRSMVACDERASAADAAALPDYDALRKAAKSKIATI